MTSNRRPPAPAARPPPWLPDWRDASAYEALKGVESAHWAWQFLRRNPEYQTAWKTVSEARAFVPAEPNETWRNYTARLAQAHARLPAHDSRDDDTSNRFNVWPRPYDPALWDPPVNFSLAAADEQPPWLDLGDGSQVAVGGSRVAIIFDLDWPLQRQLEMVPYILSVALTVPRDDEDSEARAPRPRGPLTKARRDDLVLYLRLLDAEATGAPPRERATVLAPGRDDSYPDRRESQRLRGRLRTAKSLRNGRYADLAYLRTKAK